MSKNYRYILSVTVRPRGAQGMYEGRDFPVLMPKEWNTPAELFDKWLAMLGDEFEPGIMDRINGEFTRGMHGHQFRGDEVSRLQQEV